MNHSMNNSIDRKRIESEEREFQPFTSHLSQEQEPNYYSFARGIRTEQVGKGPTPRFDAYMKSQSEIGGAQKLRSISPSEIGSNRISQMSDKFSYSPGGLESGTISQRNSEFLKVRAAERNQANENFRPLSEIYNNREIECSVSPDTYRQEHFIRPARPKPIVASPNNDQRPRRSQAMESRSSSPSQKENSFLYSRSYSNPFKSDYENWKRSPPKMRPDSLEESDAGFSATTQPGMNQRGSPLHTKDLNGQRGQLTPDKLPPQMNNRAKSADRVSPFSNILTSESLRQNTEGRLISDPNQNQSFLTTKPSLTVLNTEEQPLNLKSIPFKIATEPEITVAPFHHRQVSIPTLKVDREAVMQGADLSPAPGNVPKRNPIFEEYRKSGFKDVPIFRAKYVTMANGNIVVPPRGESRTPERVNQYIPKHSSNQSHHQDQYAQKENTYSKVSPFEKPNFFEPVNGNLAESSFHSPPKRTRQAPMESMQRSPPGNRVSSEQYIYTEGSHKAEDYNPGRRIMTNDYNDNERFYPIFTATGLDYPYLIISTTARKEPEKEVYVEKKRKKKDDIDPFLQTLAKTFVPKGDDTSRRKSRALLKFEQAALLADEEGEQEGDSQNALKKAKSVERVKSNVREEPNPLNLSQISQQESIMFSKKPSFLEPGRSSKDFDIKPQQEETPKMGSSPEGKRKPAIRLSGKFTNPLEKKKDSVVRISVPEKSSDQGQEPLKKIDSKHANFLKKLEDMQNKSQRRLTALIQHNEEVSPVQRKSVVISHAIIESEDSATS